MSISPRSSVSAHCLPVLKFGSVGGVAKPNGPYTTISDVNKPDLGRDFRTGSQEWSCAICDGIIDLLSVLFEVDSKQLRSSKRTKKPIARVRQIGMYVAHVTFGMRMAEVGAGFGRDKSTILYACHLIEDMRDDEEFDMIVARVEKILTAAFAFGNQGTATTRAV